jgi:hypothetical protein
MCGDKEHQGASAGGQTASICVHAPTVLPPLILLHHCKCQDSEKFKPCFRIITKTV